MNPPLCGNGLAQSQELVLVGRHKGSVLGQLVHRHVSSMTCPADQRSKEWCLPLNRMFLAPYLSYTKLIFSSKSCGMCPLDPHCCCSWSRVYSWNREMLSSWLKAWPVELGAIARAAKNSSTFLKEMENPLDSQPPKTLFCTDGWNLPSCLQVHKPGCCPGKQAERQSVPVLLGQV